MDADQLTMFNAKTTGIVSGDARPMKKGLLEYLEKTPYMRKAAKEDKK